MYTLVDHLYKHLTHPKHLLHNMLLSIGVAGVLMAADQFYTGNYQLLAAGYMPAHSMSILPESIYSEENKNNEAARSVNYTDSVKSGALVNGIYKVPGLPDLIPATNSVRGVCYMQGTDMWDVRSHRTCTTGEPVCRTIKGVIIGCESKRIIR